MRFGVRECADVVLRAKTTQKIGKKIFYKHEPVCYFDTLKTSTMEGAGTTVYAQGGRGNARLMSWDGERTVTFTMEDALISPIGLSILTGAGLIEAGEKDADGETKKVIQHITETVEAKDNGTITLEHTPYYKWAESGEKQEDYIYVMKLDGNHEIISEPYIYRPTAQGEKTIELAEERAVDYEISSAGLEGEEAEIYKDGPRGQLVLVDYYTEHATNAMEITITPDKFGGTFYLEASTLWKDQATGKDLPAEFIIPKCRVQSNFSFTMSGSGDPSTFTFTMDAFPDYTRFNNTTKCFADIQVIGGSAEGEKEYQRLSTKSNHEITDDGKVKDETTDGYYFIMSNNVTRLKNTITIPVITNVPAGKFGTSQVTVLAGSSEGIGEGSYANGKITIPATNEDKVSDVAVKCTVTHTIDGAPKSIKVKPIFIDIPAAPAEG